MWAVIEIGQKYKGNFLALLEFLHGILYDSYNSFSGSNWVEYMAEHNTAKYNHPASSGGSKVRATGATAPPKAMKNPKKA